MKLTIQGSAKEIAALVLVVQERREEASMPAINVNKLFGTHHITIPLHSDSTASTGNHLVSSSDYKRPITERWDG